APKVLAFRVGVGVFGRQCTDDAGGMWGLSGKHMAPVNGFFVYRWRMAPLSPPSSDPSQGHATSAAPLRAGISSIATVTHQNTSGSWTPNSLISLTLVFQVSTVANENLSCCSMPDACNPCNFPSSPPSPNLLLSPRTIRP